MKAKILKVFLAIALVVLGLLGFYLWIRDSGLVSVKKVEVLGLRSADKTNVRIALEDAAFDMTTLHVRMGDLHKAVQEFPQIGGLTVKRDLPHGLQIRVKYRKVIALLLVTGRKLPVSDDGKVFNNPFVRRKLPLIEIDTVRVKNYGRDPKIHAAIKIIQGAPSGFARRISTVRDSNRGLVIKLRQGPKVYFGDASDVALKWSSLVHILSDPKARGATYIDVEVANRPAVGGVTIKGAEQRPDLLSQDSAGTDTTDTTDTQGTTVDPAGSAPTETETEPTPIP